VSEPRKYFVCKNEGCNNETPPPRLNKQRKKGSHIHYAQCHTCSNLVWKYGIHNGDRLKILEETNWECKLCLCKMELPNSGEVTNRASNNPAIDHDHSKEIGDDGFIRGVICSQCNRALGLFGDDLERIKRVVKYMRGDLQ
jgi:hypothetical protein